MDELKKILQHHPVVCGVLLLLVLWFCLFRNGNYGTGIDTTGSQLESIGHQQQEITRGTEAAEKTVDNIDRSIRESAEIIADCKRILEAVRKRNEIQTEPN